MKLILPATILIYFREFTLCRDVNAKWIWTFSGLGSYSVNVAYSYLRNEYFLHLSQLFKFNIKKLNCLAWLHPRVQLFIWKLLNEKIHHKNYYIRKVFLLIKFAVDAIKIRLSMLIISCLIVMTPKNSGLPCPD